MSTSWANIITIIRILLLPIVIYSIYQENLFYASLGLGIFLLMVFSDFLDGHIARKRKEVTAAGTFLDPLSDKIVVIVLLIIFLVRGEKLLLIPVIVFIIRDFVINGIRTIAASENIVIAANKYGKLKTVLQFVLIGLLFLKEIVIAIYGLGNLLFSLINYGILIFAVLAVIFSLFSMCNYGWKYKKISRRK